MASKLELTFISSGVIEQTLTIRTGVTYTFKTKRLGFRQVKVISGTVIEGSGAEEFKNAYTADDNYAGQSKVTQEYTVDGMKITIENDDNSFFDGFSNNTTFIGHEVTSTAQAVPTSLDVSLSESPTDACGKFLLNLDSNVIGGRLSVEIPIGNTVLDIPASELPYAFDRLRPALSKSSVVKLYETETSSSVLRSVLFTAPPVLSLSSVTVNGSPFGAAIVINAEGSNLEYSLDNISFQGSKEYSGLLEGSYTAYVKDAYGCSKSLAFSVSAADTEGLSVPPLIKVPIHNSLRFAERSGTTFLNFLASETPSFMQVSTHFQEYLTGDVVRTQFKSSYPINRAFVYDCEGSETELTLIQKSDNISRKNTYDGNYVNFEGRLAIYFDSGNTYNPDLSLKGTHSLGGLLPDWYEKGMYVLIEGIGATVIDRIVFDEDSELRYAVTLKSGIGEGLAKKITSIHTADPYEVYEFDLNLLTEGKFLCKIDYGVGEYLSEPIKVSESLSEKYLKVEWFSGDNNDILYNTGIKQIRRLKWSNYFTYISKSEKEAFYSDTTLGIVNSKSHSTYELSFIPMPMEMARGLDFGFNAMGAKVVINCAVFVCDGSFKAEPFGSLYKVSAELTLTDQIMKGGQLMDGIINAEFLIIEQDADGVKFLKI